MHHTLEGYLDAYIDSAGIREETKECLFRTLMRSSGRPLSLTPLSQPHAWQMIRRRARTASILTPSGCHTFRATGITAYLENGGTLEHTSRSRRTSRRARRGSTTAVRTRVARRWCPIGSKDMFYPA